VPPAALRLLPLVLALAAPARADVIVPRGDLLVLRQAGGVETAITVRALLSDRADEAGGPAALAEPLPVQTLRLPPFTPDSDALVSGITTPHMDLKIRIGWEAGSGFLVKVTARPTAQTWVRLLALELELDADGMSLLGRDLRPLSPESVAVLGRLDPKWVTLTRRGRPFLTLVASDQFDGLQVRRAGGRVRLRLDLLSVEARPFFHFAACTDYWKDPNQRLHLPARIVLPGESMDATLSLYSGAATPLVKARFPDGRRAALVITDHADQTAAPTLRTIAGGTSDMNDPRWGQSGLLGHGLAITKALWLKSGERDPQALRPGQAAAPGPLQNGVAGRPQNGKGRPPRPAAEAEAGDAEFLDELGRGVADENGGGRPQLDDPQVVALADRLHAAGWEIIPHSATPIRDGRDLTRQALLYFRRFNARSWIDHQPYTNCEALVNQGYRQGPFGIADLLSAQGYQYAWAGRDVAPGDLNLLMPRRLDRYVPVIWPVGRLASGMPADLWLFLSMLSFVETPRFFEMYGAEAIDRLERERGLHIAHTYLENIHPPASWFGRRNLLQPGERPREVVLDPRLDALFSALAARVARGSLWVPTLSRLGDHLRAMAGVSVTLETDGSATLQSKLTVSGATFVVPRPALVVEVNGRPPMGVRYIDGETSFWLDLPAGRPVRVRLKEVSGMPVSFLSGKPLPLLGRLP
jgi:hypothetical protein